MTPSRSPMLLGLLCLLLSFGVGGGSSSSNDDNNNNNNCPLKSVGCVCEEYDGGHDLWCPDRKEDYKFRIHYQGGLLFIECNLEKAERKLNSNDLLFQAKDLNLGKELESLRLRSCPLLTESYSRLLSLMNVSSLKELVVQYGDGEQGQQQLVANQFSGLNNLLALKVEKLSLSGISADAFQGLPRLKTLVLDGNALNSLEPDVFKPLSQLLHLNLLEPDLSQMPEQIFASLENLEQLKISAKSLTALPPKLFGSQRNLKGLEFMRLNLATIPSELFGSTSNLRNFTMSGRGFESAPASIFANTLLERFDWTLVGCSPLNCTVSLQSSFLKNLITLEYFGFSNLGPIGKKTSTTTTNIAEDFFHGCTALQEMKLTLVGLNEIPSALFRDSKSLKKINMSGNKISRLSDTTFQGLNKLKELILKDNNINNDLNGRLFEDLINLRVLTLSKNNIAAISEAALKSLVNLEDLNLDNNRIYMDDDDQPKWHSLTALKNLNLARNNLNLTSVPPSLSLVLELQSLNLSRNSIGPFLDVHYLNFQQNSIVVDLSYNKIRLLNFETALLLPKMRSGEQTSGERRIILDGNPIECNCKALNLSKFLKGDFSGKSVQSWFSIERGDDFKCAEPKELRGEKVHNLANDQFVCPFPSSEFPNMTCPSQCSCQMIPSLPKIEVDCSKKDLAAFPNFIPVAQQVNSVSLNLCHNNISKLTGLGSSVDNFSAITELLLCRNSIKEVSHLDLPPSVRNLSLSDNVIKMLDHETLKFFQTLEAISLGGNRYGCDCKSVPLLDFVKKYADKVVDVSNVTIECNGEVRPIVEWTSEDLCVELLDIVLPVVFLLVVISLIIVILCLRYKQPIHIWIYSHRRLRRLCFIEDLEDRPFDAFISYSNEDREFVENYLVPQLESGEDLKYRCLVHVRDFDVGRPIVDQINEAVDKSSRTVIVLSRNFVRSEWYQHEFSAAHNRKRVIVILYGELPTETEMGPVMWQYIKTNTYLTHDDAWFWDKLRYALPHRGRRQHVDVRSVRRGNTDEIGLIDQKNGGRRGVPNPNFLTSTEAMDDSPPTSTVVTYACPTAPTSA